MAIEPVASLVTYFRDAVVSATSKRKVKLREPTTEYLARMLSGVAEGRHNGLLEGSVVLALDDAMTYGVGEQVLRLQSIGDATLFAVSFFPEQIAQGGQQTGLYVNVGAFAYGRAAQLTQRTGGEPRVLLDLKEGFGTVVDVLAEVAESSSLGAVTRDVVKLFDRWKQTGSERVLEQMARMGAFPIGPMAGLEKS